MEMKVSPDVERVMGWFLKLFSLAEKDIQDYY